VKKNNKEDMALKETLESLWEAEGKEINPNIPNHVALLLAFTDIQWGEENIYKNRTIFLNKEDFIKNSLSERKRMIRRFLDDVVVELIPFTHLGTN